GGGRRPSVGRGVGGGARALRAGAEAADTCGDGSDCRRAHHLLPETIGGVRNWDYRYCWIRDAAMTADAFLVTGHGKEMNDYVLWAERASESAESESGHLIRIMYGLHGEMPQAAEQLDHLEGY